MPVSVAPSFYQLKSSLRNQVETSPLTYAQTRISIDLQRVSSIILKVRQLTQLTKNREHGKFGRPLIDFVVAGSAVTTKCYRGRRKPLYKPKCELESKR